MWRWRRNRNSNLDYTMSARQWFPQSSMYVNVVISICSSTFCKINCKNIYDVKCDKYKLTLTFSVRWSVLSFPWDGTLVDHDEATLKEGTGPSVGRSQRLFFIFSKYAKKKCNLRKIDDRFMPFSPRILSRRYPHPLPPDAAPVRQHRSVNDPHLLEDVITSVYQDDDPRGFEGTALRWRMPLLPAGIYDCCAGGRGFHHQPASTAAALPPHHSHQGSEGRRVKLPGSLFKPF